MPLPDRHGRVATRLRLSVTDRCDLRCTYCMPADPTWLPHSEILTFEELLRLTRIAVGLGVERVRVTGGEPLVRKDLPTLIRGLHGLEGLKSVSLTTNGTQLKEMAPSLRDAGLSTLNVSLDTLNATTFRTLARTDGLDKVLAGIEEADRLGFRLKLNMVVVRGLNDAEIPAFGRLARERGWDIRFIEFMPLDGDRTWNRTKVVPAAEIRAALEAVAPLAAAPSNPSDPARAWRFADGKGRIGIIASVTEPFCETCDRIRITADGKIRTCLFATTETDLKTAMRQGADDETLAEMLAGAVLAKGPGHLINTARFEQPERAMHAIGG